MDDLGPGDFLMSVIPQKFKRTGCGCQKYACQMNGWGLSGCIERTDEIVAHLVSKRPAWVPKRLADRKARQWWSQAIEAYEFYFERKGNKNTYPRFDRKPADSTPLRNSGDPRNR